MRTSSSRRATAPVRGVQAIHDMYAQFTRRYPDGNTPKTAHVTSNLIIEADGTEAARSQAYFLVHQATEALPLQPIIGGRYFDKFARVSGQWRFSERRIEIDLVGNLSAHMLQAIEPKQARPDRSQGFTAHVGPGGQHAA